MDWTVSSQTSCIEVLTPTTFECNLIWRHGVSSGNRIKMRSLGWALVQFVGCLIKRRNLDRATQRGKIIWRNRENTMRTWRRPLINQGKRPGTDPSLTSLRGNQLCRHLGFGHWASRMGRQYISVAQAIHLVVPGNGSTSSLKEKGWSPSERANCDEVRDPKCHRNLFLPSKSSPGNDWPFQTLRLAPHYLYNTVVMTTGYKV